MRSLYIILAFSFLFSCGNPKYIYNEKTKSIISNKFPITHIFIKDTTGRFLAEYEPLPGESSKLFSLETFSPETFICMSGCPFSFQKKQVYLINIFPEGDRAILPIRMQTDTSGKIKTLKY